MKPTDELYLLIKSMDKNEKGYFRKFSRLHGTAREGYYLKLFDRMAAMEDYSDAKLRQQFTGEKFIKQLSAHKHYLKNMIIRALRNYHEERLPKLQYLLSMADAQIMIHKKMNASLKIRFEKEAKNALATERFVDYMLWANLYHDWLGVYGYAENFEGVRQKLLLEHNEVARIHQNLIEYLTLSAEVSSMNMRAGIDPPEAMIKEMHHLLETPLLTKADAPKSDKARNTRKTTLALLYQRTGQKDKVIALLRGEIESRWANYTGENPTPNNYLVDINRLLNMLRINDTGEIWRLLKKFEGILEIYKNTIPNTNKWNAEMILLIQKCRYYHFKRQPQKILQLTAVIKDKLEAEPQPFPHHQLLSLGYEAIARLELKQYDNALKIANRILNTNFNVRPDLLLTFEWIRIVVHLESGNFALVKTLIGRAMRQSKKLNVKPGHETEIYRYLSELADKLQHKKKPEIRAVATKYLQFLDTEIPDEMYEIKNWLTDIIARHSTGK